VKQFGDVVPIVRCIDHGTNMVLNISVGGQIYWSSLPWERLFTQTKSVRNRKAKECENNVAKFTIPPENLEIPEDMRACAANLQKIYTGIRKFEAEKGGLPKMLAELAPAYLSQETLEFWNDPASTGTRLIYEFTPGRVSNEWPVIGGMRFCDWKQQQMKLFGDVVPIIRCRMQGRRYLNMSVDGRAYVSPHVWERMFIPGYTHGDEMRQSR
jgi:hypothetical protein